VFSKEISKKTSGFVTSLTFYTQINKNSSVMAPYNKYLYIAFVAMGLYFLVSKEPSWDSISFLGIALAFDPFDQDQPWGQRPVWQRGILLVHLMVVLGLVGMMLFASFG
jgi:hypothetical protein